MHLRGHDGWSTRSDLDPSTGPGQAQGGRCWLCDAPLSPSKGPEGHVPWSFWSSDGVSASLCDDCAPAEPPDAR
jgi:hypothetical protein